MRRDWGEVIETTAADNDPLHSILWDYSFSAMKLSDLQDNYQEELGRIIPEALKCELEVYLQNTVQDSVERSSMLSTLFFYPLSWLLTIKNAQHPPSAYMKRALFHSAEGLYTALEALRPVLKKNNVI